MPIAGRLDNSDQNKIFINGLAYEQVKHVEIVNKPRDVPKTFC